MVRSLRPRAAVISQRIGQRLASLRPNFDGHLIRGAADTPRADLDRGMTFSSAVWKDAERILADAALDLVERAIDDRLGDRLLAGIHHRIHELGDDRIAETWDPG
jgi:hypothetical protein